MKCEQELCPFWSGSGCACAVVGIGATDRNVARNASEGWAAYAAEQERHAETAHVLESLRDDVARMHDRYAVAPGKPRCCSDCAAIDFSSELRRVLRRAMTPKCPGNVT